MLVCPVCKNKFGDEKRFMKFCPECGCRMPFATSFLCEADYINWKATVESCIEREEKLMRAALEEKRRAAAAAEKNAAKSAAAGNVAARAGAKKRAAESAAAGNAAAERAANGNANVSSANASEDKTAEIINAKLTEAMNAGIPFTLENGENVNKAPTKKKKTYSVGMIIFAVFALLFVSILFAVVVAVVETILMEGLS